MQSSGHNDLIKEKRGDRMENTIIVGNQQYDVNVLEEAGFKIESNFKAHGYYIVSNCVGYEVELNDSCDGGRLRDSETGEVSDWTELEYIEPENADSEDGEWIIPIWGGVPLNQVMRI